MLITSSSKSDRSHVVLWAKELPSAIVFLRPLGLRLAESVKASLKTFSLDTQDQQAKQMYDQLAQNMTNIVNTLQARVNYVEQQEKSDRSHVVLWAKELPSAIVFLRPLGLRLKHP